MNALTDGPDLGFARQSCECLDRIIGPHVIKLAHQSLVGSENDRANRTRIGLSFPFYHQGRWLAFPKARAQPQLHGPIVVGQRAHRFLVLSDTRGGQGFHRADDRLEITGTPDLSAQARRGVAHGFSLSAASGFGLGFGLEFGLASVGPPGLDPSSGLGLASGLGSALAAGLAPAFDSGSIFDPSLASGLASGLGLQGASALRAISIIALRSSSLSLSALSNRAHTSAGMLAAASCTACSAFVIWSSGTGSKSSEVNASRTAICAGTDTGANSGCLRQARIRRPCSMILRVS